jgi:hypothetical protein
MLPQPRQFRAKKCALVCRLCAWLRSPCCHLQPCSSLACGLRGTHRAYSRIPDFTGIAQNSDRCRMRSGEFGSHGCVAPIPKDAYAEFEEERRISCSSHWALRNLAEASSSSHPADRRGDGATQLAKGRSFRYQFKPIQQNPRTSPGRPPRETVRKSSPHRSTPCICFLAGFCGINSETPARVGI